MNAKLPSLPQDLIPLARELRAALRDGQRARRLLSILVRDTDPENATAAKGMVHQVVGVVIFWCFLLRCLRRKGWRFQWAGNGDFHRLTLPNGTVYRVVSELSVEKYDRRVGAGQSGDSNDPQIRLEETGESHWRITIRRRKDWVNGMPSGVNFVAEHRDVDNNITVVGTAGVTAGDETVSWTANTPQELPLKTATPIPKPVEQDVPDLEQDDLVRSADPLRLAEEQDVFHDDEAADREVKDVRNGTDPAS